MECLEVTTASDVALFHQVAVHVYASDAHYIPHLIEDIEAIFNNQNELKLAKRWVILINKKPIGRIAAFTTADQNTGGLGFFECINNKSIAHFLFQTGIDWLRTLDVQSVQAPINFGERDKFWGLLVEGFSANSYQENYNPLYYKKLIEDFGFKKDFNQTTFIIEKKNFDGDRILRLYQRVSQNKNFKFRHFDNTNSHQFARDFASIYNQAWQGKNDFKKLDDARVLALFKAMKPVIQNNLIWMAYDNEQPIGFFINILEINYALKLLKGKKSIIGGLRYKIKRIMMPPNTSKGIVFGIIPAYQNKGVDIGLIYHFRKIVLEDANIQYCILSWIGDFNNKMNSLMRALGAQTHKVHTTYVISTL